MSRFLPSQEDRIPNRQTPQWQCLVTACRDSLIGLRLWLYSEQGHSLLYFAPVFLTS